MRSGRHFVVVCASAYGPCLAGACSRPSGKFELMASRATVGSCGPSKLREHHLSIPSHPLCPDAFRTREPPSFSLLCKAINYHSDSQSTRYLAQRPKPQDDQKKRRKAPNFKTACKPSVAVPVFVPSPDSAKFPPLVNFLSHLGEGQYMAASGE